MLKVTGGIWKGRSYSAPPENITRPTQSRLREVVFDMTQSLVPDGVFLDVFSGSGGMGLEALSRGAERAYFIENHRRAIAEIQANLKKFQVPKDQGILLPFSFELALLNIQKMGVRFELVFADPPYQMDLERKLLSEADWGRLLEDHGRLILEWKPKRGEPSELEDEVGDLKKVREKRYGDTILTTYKKNEGEHQK